MPQIDTSTIRTDSVQLGAGSDLVLAHGLAANQAFWYFQIAPALAKHYRVTLYDLRGHGNSELPPTGYSTRDLADDLRALLDARDIAVADLVGHSFGGAISLHFAARYPDRVRSLTLLDSRLHALQPFNSPEDQTYWNDQRERLSARGHPIPPGTPRWLMPMLDELEASRGDAQAPGPLPGVQPRKGIWDPRRRSAKRWLKLVQETTFLEDLRDVAGLTPETISGIGAPTLLVYGDRSLLLPTFHALVRLLPNVRSRIIPNAGHFFPLVRPDRVIDAVEPFLREQRGPTTP